MKKDKDFSITELFMLICIFSFVLFFAIHIEMQKKYKISVHKTFIIGFSQGAMLALYSALSNKNVLGGVFSLSGLIEKRMWIFFSGL